MRSHTAPRYALLLALSLSALACKTIAGGTAAGSQTLASSAGSGRDETAKSFYSVERVEKVELTMRNWDNLRKQEPKGGRCVFAFMGEQYDNFHVEELKVNGQSFYDVAAKKSSYCGSLSNTKPNIKIAFGKFDKSQAAKAIQTLGTDSLVLKNSVQDPSLVRQCLAAEIFGKAGFPLQRCNFMQVFVNGQKIGLYVNLEPTDKFFFARTLGTPTGNLYEVAGEELDTWALERFKLRLDSYKDPEDTSASDMNGLINAAKNDNSSDLSQLRQHLDIDDFIKFWAMEIIMVHWDGFANNVNNSMIYFDPRDSKAHMLPRGMDQVLTDYPDTREPHKPLTQVFYKQNSLTAKLASNPKYLQQLKDTVQSYLDRIWNEQELLNRAEYLTSLASPHIPGWGGNNETKWSHDRLISVIKSRKQDIASFLGTASGDGGGGSAIDRTVTCSSGDSDPDRDGWGWENGQSCKTPTSGAPRCERGRETDTDGDGWGWENNRSCQVR